MSIAVKGLVGEKLLALVEGLPFIGALADGDVNVVVEGPFEVSAVVPVVELSF